MLVDMGYQEMNAVRPTLAAALILIFGSNIKCSAHPLPLKPFPVILKHHIPLNLTAFHALPFTHTITPVLIPHHQPILFRPSNSFTHSLSAESLIVPRLKPMSFLASNPEALTAAAHDFVGIGSTIGAANAAAEAPTTGIVHAAQDEVSAAIARLFGAHGQEFQALSAQAALFHKEFANALSAGSRGYERLEAENLAP
jgi:PE family